MDLNQCEHPLVADLTMQKYERHDFAAVGRLLKVDIEQLRIFVSDAQWGKVEDTETMANLAFLCQKFSAVVCSNLLATVRKYSKYSNIRQSLDTIQRMPSHWMFVKTIWKQLHANEASKCSQKVQIKLKLKFLLQQKCDPGGTDKKCNNITGIISRSPAEI